MAEHAINVGAGREKRIIVDSRYQEHQEDTSEYNHCHGDLQHHNQKDVHLFEAVIALLHQATSPCSTLSLKLFSELLVLDVDRLDTYVQTGASLLLYMSFHFYLPIHLSYTNTANITGYKNLISF